MRLAPFLPASLLMVSSLATAAVAVNRPVDDSSVAAVFPPWWSSSEIIDAAESVGVVLPDSTRRIVFLRSPSADLPGRAAAAGAILVFAGSTLGFCTSK